jgi:hypothetical protein
MKEIPMLPNHVEIGDIVYYTSQSAENDLSEGAPKARYEQSPAIVLDTDGTGLCDLIVFTKSGGTDFVKNCEYSAHDPGLAESCGNWGFRA